MTRNFVLLRPPSSPRLSPHKPFQRRRRRTHRPRTSSAPAASTAHDDHEGEIVIRGRYIGNLDLLAGTAVLDGVELQRDMRGQLGDTLAKVAGRVGDLLLARLVAAGAARFPGRAHPRAGRRHRLDRRVEHLGRPCGDDRPADRRADRGASRPRGAAVRRAGDRRRGQRHRQAHPARRSRERLSRRRDRRAWQRGGRALGRRRRATSRSATAASSRMSTAAGARSDDLRTGGYVSRPAASRRAVRDRRGRTRGRPCRGGRRSARAGQSARQDPQQPDQADLAWRRPLADPRQFHDRRVGQPLREQLRRADAARRRASSRGRRGRGRGRRARRGAGDDRPRPDAL